MGLLIVLNLDNVQWWGLTVVYIDYTVELLAEDLNLSDYC